MVAEAAEGVIEVIVVDRTAAEGEVVEGTLITQATAIMAIIDVSLVIR